MDDGLDKSKKDKLISNYDSIIRESALLATVAGILFGFLLNISISPPEEFEFADKIILLVALFSITVAILLFSMPVIYHHLQFPYSNFDKFQLRSHKFIVYGSIPFFFTLYLSLTLAISVFLDLPYTIVPIRDLFSFALSLVPFVTLLILYKMRK